MTAKSEREPGYDRLPMLQVTNAEQMRALANITRHRILGLLHDRGASATQIAQELGILKGSAGYHLKVLERAGLVKLVGSRKVRGVTERFFGRTARAIETDTGIDGGRGLLWRVLADDVEDAERLPTDLLVSRRVRLSEAELVAVRRQLEAVLEQVIDRADPQEPLRTIAVALYTVTTS